MQNALKRNKTGTIFVVKTGEEKTHCQYTDFEVPRTHPQGAAQEVVGYPAS